MHCVTEGWDIRLLGKPRLTGRFGSRNDTLALD